MLQAEIFLKIQKKTTAVVSFLIKLQAEKIHKIFKKKNSKENACVGEQAEGTISTSNGWQTCAFLLAASNKPKLSAPFLQCVLTHNRKFRSVFIRWISYLMSEVAVIVCEKKPKSNETNTFAQSLKSDGFLSSI